MTAWKGVVRGAWCVSRRNTRRHVALTHGVNHTHPHTHYERHPYNHSETHLRAPHFRVACAPLSCGPVDCRVRFVSSGQYLFVSFVTTTASASSSQSAASNDTSQGGFTAAVSSAPLYYMADGCPGPSALSVSSVAVVALASPTRSSSVRGVDCAVAVQAAVAGLLLELTVDAFLTQPVADVLTVFDGDSESSPQLATLSGAYAANQLST